MTDMIAKCGNNCTLCPWSRYTRERITPENWDSYREGVKKYVGYAIEDLKPCYGCQTPTEKLARDVGVHNFLRGCLTRKCALYNGVETCAHCSRYPCYQIRTMGAEFTIEKVAERIGHPIPDAAYEAYIKPFEGMKHLDEIRSSLNQDDIVEMKSITPKKVTIVDLPKDLPLTTQEPSAYKMLHQTLSKIAHSSLGLQDIDTYAVSEQLEKRRKGVFRFLWVLGLHGELKEGDKLVIDSITYFSNKTRELPFSESRMNLFIDILKKHKIHTELVPLVEKVWKLESGNLRKKVPRTDKPAWLLQASFGESIGGADVLKTLKSYSTALYERYGNRGFTRFSRIDMRFRR